MNRLPHHRSFLRGIHWSPVDSPQKGQNAEILYWSYGYPQQAFEPIVELYLDFEYNDAHMTPAQGTYLLWNR